MNPQFATALVCEEQDKMIPRFLGSCFAYRQQNHFITAAHVVKNRKIEEICILSPIEGVYSKVSQVYMHPEADIAIISLSHEGRDIIQPFESINSNYFLGSEYFAYGFPEDYLGPNKGEPTERLFRGYIQRFMEHKSHLGYEYVAAELSSPCPGGLSGGPLFAPDDRNKIIGLVTENIEVATLLDEEEKILSNGKVVNESYRRVINYGVAIILDEVEEWIESHVYK